MPMELVEELPAMLALFMCGVAGYYATKWFGRPMIPMSKQAQCRAKAVEDPEEVLRIDCARAAGSKQARRRARRDAAAAPPAALDELAAPAAPAAASLEAAGPASAEAQAAAQQDSPPPVSDRVARLLAKKAERKARKAALLRLEQEAVAAAPTTELDTELEEDACDCKTGSILAAEVSSACTTPSAIPPSSSVESLGQAEAADMEAGSEPMDETDSASTFSKASVARGGEPQELLEDAELGDAPACTGTAATCSDDDEEWMSEETASDVPWQWTAGQECTSSSEDLPQWVPRGQGTPSRRWPESGVDREDGWMRSFDELIGVPRAGAAEPTVCMWKGPCIPDPAVEGVYTDGRRVYQPVRSGSGQALVTDGESLFLCVVVPNSMGVPEEMAPSCPEFSSCGAEQKQAFDPYDPLGLAGLQEPGERRAVADRWDTAWG